MRTLSLLKYHWPVMHLMAVHFSYLVNLAQNLDNDYVLRW